MPVQLPVLNSLTCPCPDCAGNSVFFNVKRIEDPIGLLPGWGAAEAREGRAG